MKYSWMSGLNVSRRKDDGAGREDRGSVHFVVRTSGSSIFISTDDSLLSFFLRRPTQRTAHQTLPSYSRYLLASEF